MSIPGDRPTLDKIKSTGNDKSDLAKVTGVLAYAARLIQEKG